jgi:hypothetical protein
MSLRHPSSYLLEAGWGRWLGVRFPARGRLPLTAAQARAAVEERIRLARKAARKAAKAEAAARARSKRLQRRGLCGTGVGPDLTLASHNGGLCGLFNLGNTVSKLPSPLHSLDRKTRQTLDC